MPMISRIAVAKKNKGRFHIYIGSAQGEEYAFTVSEDLFIKRGLRKGLELTEAEICEIREADQLDKAMQKVLNYLSYRMRSEKEVYIYLAELEVKGKDAAQIVARLKELQFLDDKLFAKAFIRTKKNTQKKGPLVIVQELQEKGISKPLIEQALAEYPEEEQLEHAVSAAVKKQTSYRNDGRKLRKQKTIQFLLQRGFPSSVVQQAVEALEEDSDDSGELAALATQGEKALKKFARYDGWEKEQRIKQFLAQRGFSFDLVEKWLRENYDS
ncbi:regulatory protein [Evansella caseinilytica]|uniref:Regulatory protein RecX n=1 Tax=Evansella caseinilytica TaxID=1503961 RepID=A0A1H3J197_9BACI|nr:recombination regulator RecX [Evansella caseinilytica]SDY33726.1 regulatory protein [Evansella caseinilytica]